MRCNICGEILTGPRYAPICDKCIYPSDKESMTTKPKTIVNEFDPYKAPCQFCGYNGEKFYQTYTHKRECPWYYVGGAEERKNVFNAIHNSMTTKSTQEKS